jgi:hypothetical protein
MWALLAEGLPQEMENPGIVLMNRLKSGAGMDQISIKTPIPNCRLYWCLIEFIDWRDSQSCWYFRPLL